MVALDHYGAIYADGGYNRSFRICEIYFKGDVPWSILEQWELLCIHDPQMWKEENKRL